MLAIITTFHRPTTMRGARVSARLADNSARVMLPWAHADSAYLNHKTAVSELCAKRGFPGPWAGCWHPGEIPRGYVWVHENQD